MKITVVIKGCTLSMEEIKKKIQYLLNIPVDSQTLSIWDLELIDGLDLDDYPLISDGTKIHLSTKHSHTTQPIDQYQPHIPTKMTITVKVSTQKLDIDVDTSTDTVGSLKEKIYILDGASIRRMTIFHNGVEMEDDFRGLDEYGIRESSEIVVSLRRGMTRVSVDPPTRKVSLVVQTSSSLMNGARIPVEMNDTSRIDELRGMLVERRLVPAEDYVFVHKQRIMSGDCSLRWHGVENGDFLYVFKGTVSRGGDF